jgi:uncharacterized protein (TIGR02147 family)
MTVPAISAGEAKKSITLLLKLGLAEKTSDGAYHVTDRFMSTGEEWHDIAVRRFQKDTILLAHDALDTVPKELRDISTVTLTLSPEGFEEVRERVRQFRRDLLNLAGRQEKPNGAYHMNIQLLPIGRPWERTQQ